MLINVTTEPTQLSDLELNTNLESSGYVEVIRDVDFTLGKSFSTSNYIDHPDYATRSALDVVNEIDEFMPEGLEHVTDVDVYYTDVSLNITQIYVIEDREFGGPGSVFLNVLLNRDYTYHDYTFDNDGSYYVASDGEIVTVNILLQVGLHSMDGKFSIEIHGWEADPIIGWPDDYMGGELFHVDLSDLVSESYTGWWSLNDYPPIGGSQPVQMQVYLNLDFTNIQRLSYPSDFSTTNDGSWLISAVYFPKVWYDTLDSAHDPIINCILEEVYYGYDPLIDDYSYLIYYMFYYDFERDNFGAAFGHYYDFEPLLMFVEEIGHEPYRIVYRDVGTYTLPPKVVIQDSHESLTSGSLNVSVSSELTPLLGDECMVEYQIKNDYFSTPAYHFETDHGLTPFMTVPHITVTNTYHQMEIGIPPGSGEAVLTPLQSFLYKFVDSVIRSAYGKLDEAFESSINVYEGVSLWNGGDYRVPENMSLTFDMLTNHFEFPYIVDCWEEVAHYTESKQDYQENGFYYDIDLGLEFVIPATVTLNVPTSVRKGQSYDVPIQIELDNEDILVKFNYSIGLGVIFHWWFISIEENMTFVGDCAFNVNLKQIDELVRMLGISGESLTGSYAQNWFTLKSFSTSTDLLGSLVSSTVEIHLLSILSDLLGSTQVGPIIKILKFFVEEIDIVARPVVCGSVTGNVEVENSAISLDTDSLVFEEGDTLETLSMTVAGGQSSSGIRIEDMRYNVEFSTDWELEFNLTSTLNNFVDDVSFDLGTFPEITVSSDDHEIEADVSTGYTQYASMEVVNDISPPEIELDGSPVQPTSSDQVTIIATITDESSLNQVILSYSTDGGSSWSNHSMTFSSPNDWYSYSIPARSHGTEVRYRVYAEDVFDNWGVSDIETYTVYNPPTTTTTTISTIGTTTGTDQTPTDSPLSGDPTLIIILAAAGIGSVIVVAAVVYVKKRE